MAKLVWDAAGEKMFEVGVDHVALYPVNASGEFTPGVAWNGITQVAETPEGAEPEKQYADNIAYLTLLSAEELNGTIEAFMYPDAWNLCDGNAELAAGVMIGQQPRKAFGLAYRTKIGNDVDGQDHGYKLHLLYNARVSPSERTYETINDSPEPITFSWEFATTPVQVTGHQPTALLVIDSTKVDAAALEALETILYGSDAAGVAEGDPTGADARLPLPDEVVEILKGNPGAAELARMRSRVSE